MNLNELTSAQVETMMREKMAEAQRLVGEAFKMGREANLLLQELRVTRRIPVYEKYNGALLEVSGVDTYGLFVYNLYGRDNIKAKKTVSVDMTDMPDPEPTNEVEPTEDDSGDHIDTDPELD